MLLSLTFLFTTSIQCGHGWMQEENIQKYLKIIIAEKSRGENKRKTKQKKIGKNGHSRCSKLIIGNKIVH